MNRPTRWRNKRRSRAAAYRATLVRTPNAPYAAWPRVKRGRLQWRTQTRGVGWPCAARRRANATTAQTT
eukprot:10924633-Lingulodinium_polyedra.AAC.1